MAIATFAFTRAALAQSLSSLDRRLNEIEPQVSAGVHNPDTASEAIQRLDEAEAEFAQIAESRNDREALLATYGRLEAMLSRMYTTYQNAKDACIETIDNGGTCNYDQPEQLALRALYPLSWLRFEGASLYSSDPARARRLLNEAIDGFTDSSLVILSPELVRENVLGRAYAERELGKYDRAEYGKAIEDFKQIIGDGAGTRQYAAAQQGLATTYAAMGRMNEAQGLTSHLAQATTGPQRNGMALLHMRDLFQAEAAAADPAKRKDLHREIVDFAREREDNKEGWAIAVASAAQYAHDPINEFGASNDPFQNWYLANILYYKHQNSEAAKYYWEAAKSGKYPKAYKYAADLYYMQGRLDMVEKVADDIARQSGNPDVQWAAYMRFKIPRIEWERGGMRNSQLENAWVAGANDYLKTYPKGQYAFEPRFRLAELLQQKKDYVAAAKQYEQVSGNPDYEFTARFNAAESYYQALGGTRLENQNIGVPGAPLPIALDPGLRAAAVRTLQQALALEPNAERIASAGQRKSLHESRGRAIYMLATLLESEPQPDYQQIASVLDGFEMQYPFMKEHFRQTFEWRIIALDKIGNYAALDREAQEFASRDTVPRDIDYVKEIGLDFWDDATVRKNAGDQARYVADAKLTAEVYDYFARMANEGKIPAKNLTGTLSILGQAYLVMGQPARAAAVFDQVVKADPASPDANAGLARLAQMNKHYKDALELWGRVESVSAESDPLFYESKYHMAEIFADEGNATSACNKLTQAQREHPNLGSAEMKSRWGELERRICQNRSEG